MTSKKQIKSTLKDESFHLTTFENIKEIDENGNEFWGARKLSKILEYSDFRNFNIVIKKAIEACKNSNQNVENHVVDFNEMVAIGSRAMRLMKSFKLSRYACYLVVQNADPSKEVVATGQTYFAIQTRLQEVQQMENYQALTNEEEKRLYLRNELKEHNIKLAGTAKVAGVISHLDYAIFQNHGYEGLYGGLNAKAIHSKKGLKKSQQILDHMGSTELAANLFRATQTEEKLKRDKIKGKEVANKTHFEVGKKVRQTIKELGGSMPESLPIEKSIKSIKQLDQLTEKSNKK